MDVCVCPEGLRSLQVDVIYLDTTNALAFDLNPAEMDLLKRGSDTGTHSGSNSTALNRAPVQEKHAVSVTQLGGSSIGTHSVPKHKFVNDLRSWAATRRKTSAPVITWRAVCGTCFKKCAGRNPHS